MKYALIKITAKFADYQGGYFYVQNYFFLKYVATATMRIQNWISSAHVMYIAFILSYIFHIKTSFQGSSWNLHSSDTGNRPPSMILPRYIITYIHILTMKKGIESSKPFPG